MNLFHYTRCGVRFPALPVHNGVIFLLLLSVPSLNSNFLCTTFTFKEMSILEPFSTHVSKVRLQFKHQPQLLLSRKHISLCRMFKCQLQPVMQRWRFKDWSQGSDSCGQICTLKASALLRIHFLLQPFCLRHAHLHQSEDLWDNKPSSLPYFFFFLLHLGGNLLTRTGKATFILAASRCQDEWPFWEDHPEGLTYSSSPAEIVFNRWVTRS